MAAAGAFFDLKNLLVYQNVLVIISSWFIITTLRKTFHGFFTDGLGRKLLPLMPIVTCEAMVWATIKWQPDSSTGEKILLGLVLGAMTANAHTVLRKFGLHDYIPGLKPGDKGFRPK
jgi:hypothetical protein